MLARGRETMTAIPSVAGQLEGNQIINLTSDILCFSDQSY